MKKLIALLILATLATGCATSPAFDQAATIIAQTVAAASPTFTATSTQTAVPANTSTPQATSTPNIALTATVEAYQVLSDVEVWLGPNSSFAFKEGYLAWRQVEPVTIAMSGPQKDSGILEGINENLSARNFVFKSKVTWEATGILICGFAFRAEPDLAKGLQYQYYFYRLSGLPAYTIDIYDSGRFKNTVSDLKFSDGIDSNNGASNEFVLVAQDNQFIVFVNGVEQGQFFDSGNQREDGLLAFLAWQDSGKGNCTFENSWLWALP